MERRVLNVSRRVGKVVICIVKDLPTANTFDLDWADGGVGKLLMDKCANG